MKYTESSNSVPNILILLFLFKIEKCFISLKVIFGCDISEPSLIISILLLTIK